MSVSAKSIVRRHRSATWLRARAHVSALSSALCQRPQPIGATHNTPWPGAWGDIYPSSRGLTIACRAFRRSSLVPLLGSHSAGCASLRLRCAPSTPHAWSSVVDCREQQTGVVIAPCASSSVTTWHAPERRQQIRATCTLRQTLCEPCTSQVSWAFNKAAARLHTGGSLKRWHHEWRAFACK